MIYSILMIGLAGFFRFRGYPKKKWVYRLLLIILVSLGIAATVDAYLHYVIGQKYFPEQPAWAFLILAYAALLALVAFLLETVFLFRFRAAAQKTSGQSEQTSSLARTV